MRAQVAKYILPEMGRD